MKLKKCPYKTSYIKEVYPYNGEEKYIAVFGECEKEQCPFYHKDPYGPNTERCVRIINQF